MKNPDYIPNFNEKYPRAEDRQDYASFVLIGLAILALVMIGTAITNSAPLPGAELMGSSINL